MRETLVAVQTVNDERGNRYEFSYYRLEEGNSYGICIRDRNGGSAMVPDLTVSKRKVNALLKRMIRGAVSPVGMQDIIEDWLIL